MIFLPSVLVSYYGHALDEKTPLLRASDALDKEGVSKMIFKLLKFFIYLLLNELIH